MPKKPMAAENKSLLTNSLWRLAQVFTGGGFTVLYTFIYTFVWSQAEYGAYGVAVTLNYLFQILSNFGFRQSINRFVAKTRGAEEYGRMAAYIKNGVKLSVLFSVATTLLTLALSFYLVTYFDTRPDRYIIVVLVAALVGMAGFALVLQGILEGLGFFKRVMLVNLTCHLTQLSILGLFLFGELTILQVLCLENGIMALSIVLFGLPVLKHYKTLPAPTANGRDISIKLIKYGLPIFINTVGGFLYTKVDVLFVKQFLTAEDTADYFLMTYIFNFPIQALGAYLFVLNTDIAMCLGQKNVNRILYLFRKSAKMGGVLGLAMVAVFFLSSYVIELILPEYTGCAHLMRLISPMFAIKGVSSVASGAFLISMGRVKAMAAITVSGGLLNVGLNFLFIPLFGADGAVYSTLIGHTLTGLTTFGYVVFRLKQLKRDGL